MWWSRSGTGAVCGCVSCPKGRLPSLCHFFPPFLATCVLGCMERAFDLAQDMVDRRADLCSLLADLAAAHPAPDSRSGPGCGSWDLMGLLAEPWSAQRLLVAALQAGLRHYQIDLKDPVLTAHHRLIDLLLQPSGSPSQQLALVGVLAKVDEGLVALGLRPLPRMAIEVEIDSGFGLRLAKAIAGLWLAVARLETHLLALDYQGCVTQ